MSTNVKDVILVEARRIAQAHGYNGLNLRQLAEEVGIKPASIYHHFASKADLVTAVAKRYWEQAQTDLDAISNEEGNPRGALRRYPEMFRRSLQSENRLCLGSFLSAEHDDLPEPVMKEVQTFADVNVAWLAGMLVSARVETSSEAAQTRAQAIFASVTGAQLMARSRSDIAFFDTLIMAYRTAGLLPE